MAEGFFPGGLQRSFLKILRLFLQAYKMTIYYTVVGTAVGLFMTTMTAYVVSRKEFKYRNIVTFMMYFTTIFGGGMIPWYLLYANVLNLKGTAF